MKKILWSFLGAFLFLGMPFWVGAQEEDLKTEVDSVESESEFISFAHIGVYNPKILSQSEESLKIGFEIANEDNFVQPQVRYGIKLSQNTENGYITLDQAVYDESIYLDPMEKKSMEVTYVLPKIFAGEYDVIVELSNDRGIIYNNSPAGTILISGSEKNNFIEVDAASCRLMVEGNSEKFNIDFGLDIDSNERVSLHCNLINTSEKEQSFLPAMETYRRSIYGESISKKDLSMEKMNPKESRVFKFDVPVANNPQSYAVKFFVKNDKKERISNDIYFQYVVRGESATVEMATFDKNYYQAGEIAKIKLLISPSADQFPGARNADADFRQDVFVKIVVKDGNGSICGEADNLKVEQVKFLREGIEIKLNKNCQSPIVEILAKNEVGQILDGNLFGEQSSETPDSIGRIWGMKIFNIFLFLTVILIIFIIIVQFFKKKKGKIGLFILALFFLGLSFINDAGAATSATGILFPHSATVQDWPVLNTASVNLTNFNTTETVGTDTKAVYYTTNANVSSYGSMTMNYCNNRNLQVSATWKSDSAGASNVFIDTITCWAGGHGNIACTNNSGLRSIARPGAVGAYSASWNFKYFAGSDGDDTDGNISLVYAVRNSPINGSCGTRNTTYAASAIAWPVSSTYCADGTNSTSPDFPVAGSSVSWTCVGANGGTNIGCTASRNASPVAGVCNSNLTKTYASTDTAWPSNVWCTAGSNPATAPTFPNPGTQTSWTCGGLNGGASATCIANRAQNGACNVNVAKTYPASTATWTSTDWCNGGSDPAMAPIFPSMGSQVTWSCGGLYGGTSVNCTAYRDYDYPDVTLTANPGSVVLALDKENVKYMDGSSQLTTTISNYATACGVSGCECTMGSNNFTMTSSSSPGNTVVFNVPCGNKEYNVNCKNANGGSDAGSTATATISVSSEVGSWDDPCDKKICGDEAKYHHDSDNNCKITNNFLNDCGHPECPAVGQPIEVR